MMAAYLSNFCLVNYYEDGYSMQLRIGDMMRLQKICVQLALGMDGLSCTRIVRNGQRCAPVILTFLHKAEGQLLVLLTFLPT